MVKKIFIFPLSSSMTLSHVSLPYHIFETRYRKMLEQSLDQNTPISVLPPDLYPFRGKTVFAGIPKLVFAHEDGRSDIVITGEVRVRVLKLDEDQFITALVEELPALSTFTAKSSDSRSLVREALQAWVEAQNVESNQKRFFEEMILDEQVSLAYAASLLVKSEREKRDFLECESWDEWAKLVLKKIGPSELDLGPYLTKLRF